MLPLVTQPVDDVRHTRQTLVVLDWKGFIDSSRDVTLETLGGGWEAVPVVLSRDSYSIFAQLLAARSGLFICLLRMKGGEDVGYKQILFF